MNGTRPFHSIVLLVVLITVETAVLAQPQFRPGNAQSLPPKVARMPGVVTFVPSASGGDQGIAVGVIPPLKQRYTDGAPVVIQVPGGVTTGGAQGPPEYAGLGFVEIRFAFPGGGNGEAASGGTYDYRGPNCIRTLADVILFATGRLADKQGRGIGDLFPNIGRLLCIPAAARLFVVLMCGQKTSFGKQPLGLRFHGSKESGTHASSAC